jgi:hypothetical protein
VIKKGRDLRRTKTRSGSCARIVIVRMIVRTASDQANTPVLNREIMTDLEELRLEEQ